MLGLYSKQLQYILNYTYGFNILAHFPMCFRMYPVNIEQIWWPCVYLVLFKIALRFSHIFLWSVVWIVVVSPVYDWQIALPWSSFSFSLLTRSGLTLEFVHWPSTNTKCHYRNSLTRLTCFISVPMAQTVGAFMTHTTCWLMTFIVFNYCGLLMNKEDISCGGGLKCLLRFLQRPTANYLLLCVACELNTSW